MFCTKCGRALVNGSKFCSVCGSKVEQSAAPLPVQPSVQTQGTGRKKKSGVIWAVIAAAAVVVLVAAVLLTGLLPFGDGISLKQIRSGGDWDSAMITVYENGNAVQEIFSYDAEVSQKVWEDVSGYKLKESAENLFDEVKSGRSVNLFLSAADYILVEVNESGVVWISDLDSDTYYTGGEKLYEKLMQIMPEERFKLGDTFGNKQYGACQLRLQTASDEDIMSAYMEDAKDVSNVVDTLKAIRVEQNMATTSTADKQIDVNLYGADGSIAYMITVDSQGYGDLYAEDWSYEIYSPELYNKLLDQIIWHNS